MCGIFGYTGFRNARNVILDCLKKLDYRGYDSAGIGVINKDELKIFKEIGELGLLEKKLPPIDVNIGIGHTRWATHGDVSIKNAHPQVSCNGDIAVVHNGIIENFKKLKEELEEKGHRFISQTDTEVIVHLIEELYKDSLKDAVFSMIKKIKGSYALAVLSTSEPDIIVGARQESPLVVGIGDNENFLTSDITALLKYTNRVIYLEDGEICVLSKNSVDIFNWNGKKIEKEIHIVDWNVEAAEKGGFPHFMLKEIYEQPHSLH
ncbi:MAG TPA: glutamine--fructose-6-phosphate aminotransferase, partial [Thermoplasmatales archaeon]|nr:glutamine--fructose-6-phosphate aminotransferase [Thermoplasmatales archaeon]